VQVGTGGKAGAAHITDDLTLADRLTGRHDVVGHMAVQGGEAVAVVDGHVVAINGVVAGAGDGAGLGGVDGSAGGCCQVDAVMVAVAAGNRMGTGAEGTGDVSAGNRVDAPFPYTR